MTLPSPPPPQVLLSLFLPFTPMGLLDGFGGAPQGTKRQKTGGEKDDKEGAKVLYRSVKELQGKMRLCMAAHEDTYLFGQEHPVATVAKQAKEKYNQHKPKNAPGERGKEHPWGPNRWSLSAAVFEELLKMHAQNSALQAQAAEIYPQVNHGELLKKLSTLVTDTGVLAATNPKEAFAYWREIVAFSDTRETKDGRQILHFRPQTKRLHTIAAKAHALLGTDPEELWDYLSLPIRANLQDGPAPMGPNERAILRAMG